MDGSLDGLEYGAPYSAYNDVLAQWCHKVDGRYLDLDGMDWMIISWWGEVKRAPYSAKKRRLDATGLSSTARTWHGENLEKGSVTLFCLAENVS